MKVVCMVNFIRLGHTLHLTIGKTYDIKHIQKSPVNTNEDRFLITNDLDHDGLYSRKYFKMLSDIREEKLNTILG